MQHPPHREWPPRVGDLVYVIETGDLGEVMSIEGSGDDCRFVVDLYPQAGGSKTAPQVSRSVVAEQEQDEAGGGDGARHCKHDEGDVIDQARGVDGLWRTDGSSIKPSWKAITTASVFDLAERAMMASAMCARTVSIGSCMIAATSMVASPVADS
jgi:hypothetical protein